MSSRSIKILVLDLSGEIYHKWFVSPESSMSDRWRVVFCPGSRMFWDALDNERWDLVLVSGEQGLKGFTESSELLSRRTTLAFVSDTPLATLDSSIFAAIQPREISNLAREIEHSVDEESRRRDRLTEGGESQLRLALTAARMSVWTWDIPRDSLRYSSDPEVVLGRSNSGLRHTFSTFLSYVHPEDREAVTGSVSSLLENGTSYDFVFRVKAPDGLYKWVESTGELFRDHNNDPLLMTGVVVDISRQKAAEEEVRRMNADLEERVMQRTLELEEINRELEAFTYSVSHDLRVPLQSIYGFVEILASGYASQLDAKGLDYLWRLKGTAERMSQLIDDFLVLSRVSRQTVSLTDVNLGSIGHHVAGQLATTYPDRMVEFSVDEDMWVTGDERLLTIVVENLIGNAWKYTGNREEASIHFGCYSDSTERVFFVKDNGAGFDPSRSDELFQPFKRLHSSREFTGTGIGLATVFRIITRHHGAIWARGEVGKGAVFLFSLGHIPAPRWQQSVAKKMIRSEALTSI